MHVLARTCTSEATCTGCGVVSRRVHSGYQRQLADTASGGREVLIDLHVRRFFCGNPVCAKTTFAEQIPGLTARYGRRTCVLQAVLQAVALALGGRAGARLTGHLACAVSRSTLVRLIRAAAEPDEGTPLVLGVDDFALRKGHVYGTILIDIETRRPVDMLPERSAESFRAWLDAHPGVEIICRDRGGCYAEGAAEGAPLAIQVADRWHLWHNLAEAVERAVSRHRSCLQEPPPEAEPAPPADQAAPAPQTGLAARTRARHAEIHAALARGLTITDISRTLRLERKTVRRYATAAAAEELIGGARLMRPGLLGPHQAWLRQRWDDGVRSTDRLYQELRDRGYSGSLRTLRRLTAQLRRDTVVPAPPSAPAAKKVASWILTPPGDLADDDRAALAQITGRCEEPKQAVVLVREFADMLCNRRGEHLEAWARPAAHGPWSRRRAAWRRGARMRCRGTPPPALGCWRPGPAGNARRRRSWRCAARSRSAPGPSPVPSPRAPRRSHTPARRRARRSGR